MAELKCTAAPPLSAIAPGQSYPLPAGRELRIGGAEGADLRLADPSIAADHARLFADGRGLYSILDLGSSGGTCVDGRQLEPLVAAKLTDGVPVRIGGVEFLFLDAAAGRVLPDLRAMRLWWDRAQPAPDALTPKDLSRWLDIFGTIGLHQRQLSPETALEWYRTYVASPRRCCLPVAVPYLVDVGSLIAFRQALLRPSGGLKSFGDRESLRYRHYLAYQQRHLCALAHHPAVRFIRERTAAVCRRPRTQKAIIVRFICDVFKWVEQEWLKRDAGNDDAKYRDDLEHCAGQLRVLTRAEDVYGFLAQLSSVMRAGRALQNLIDPLERFLLGARAQKETAFDTFDAPLINECLLSRGLDEETFDPDPLERQPREPESPSRDPGEETTIRRVRVTNRVEKLPQVIPQELALLRLPSEGKRHLLSRLFVEGLKMWERQDYDTEVRRRRYLACFIADIGPYTRPTAQGGGRAFGIGGAGDARGLSGHRAPERSSPSIHARRLIFEFLCDIAAFVDVPELEMDIHVFLHPVDGDAQDRRHWALTLADLRTTLGRSKFDDMIELESRSPGYFFFDRQKSGDSDASHAQWIHRLFESARYDLMLFTLLAPPQTLFSLLPHDAPPPRKTQGVKDMVRLVQLDRWPNAVETAVAPSFDQAAFGGDLEYCFDVDLRYAVLEDLIGRCRRESGETPEFSSEP